MTDAVAAPTAPAPQGTPATTNVERNLLAPESAVPAVEKNLLADAPKTEAAGATGAVDPAKPEATKEEAKPEPVKLKAEDYKLTVPEGMDSKDPAVGAFAAAAAEQGIPPEQAQKLMNSVAPEIVKAMTQPYQAWKDLQENWQSQVRSDPEIGGAKFEAEVLPTIAKAMDKYGDPGLREALTMTGAGNNPAIIKTLYTFARMVTEGGPVQGNPVASKQSPGERMYDHPTSRGRAA